MRITSFSALPFSYIFQATANRNFEEEGMKKTGVAFLKQLLQYTVGIYYFFSLKIKVKSTKTTRA